MTAVAGQTASPFRVAVYGPHCVLDLVVPGAATVSEVARVYADQSGLPRIPLLHTTLGRALEGPMALVDSDVVSGDVLVAVPTTPWPPAESSGGEAARDESSEQAAATAATVSLATAAGLLAVFAAVVALSGGSSTWVAGLLIAMAAASCWPRGPQASVRALTTPGFAAAGTFAWLGTSHPTTVVIAVSAMVAAAVAGVVRIVLPEAAESLKIMIITCLVVASVCGLSPVLAWESQVSWSLLITASALAARIAPAYALAVPDDALLDLDLLGVTAWSARDRVTGQRGRAIARPDLTAGLVERASSITTSMAASVLAVVAVAAPMLMLSATLSVDRLGARAQLLAAGAVLLLAARSYTSRRLGVARLCLRLAGVCAWTSILVGLAPPVESSRVVAFAVSTIIVGGCCVVAGVAVGRGWRSAWWTRRAEVLEVLAGSLVVAATLVSSGIFRLLWESTS